MELLFLTLQEVFFALLTYLILEILTMSGYKRRRLRTVIKSPKFTPLFKLKFAWVLLFLFKDFRVEDFVVARIRPGSEFKGSDGRVKVYEPDGFYDSVIVLDSNQLIINYLDVFEFLGLKCPRAGNDKRGCFGEASPDKVKDSIRLYECDKEEIEFRSLCKENGPYHDLFDFINTFYGD